MGVGEGTQVAEVADYITCQYRDRVESVMTGLLELGIKVTNVSHEYNGPHASGLFTVWFYRPDAEDVCLKVRAIRYQYGAGR